MDLHDRAGHLVKQVNRQLLQRFRTQQADATAVIEYLEHDANTECSPLVENLLLFAQYCYRYVKGENLSIDGSQSPYAPVMAARKAVLATTGVPGPLAEMALVNVQYACIDLVEQERAERRAQEEEQAS